jgi:2-dehydro-3-deoxyphosphogluconate aldolase / (4S)-4-hydroxy-2-oxoglutarate aldolase
MSMASFLRINVLNEVIRTGVIPVFYNSDLETAKKIVCACFEGGARVIEFTNRGDNAYRIFSDLVQHFAKENPLIILGAGSIGDPATGALFMASGANFIVGPVLNPELARMCNRRKVVYSPGCGSATEIAQAEEFGVEIVKLFPGDSVGGPKFVKSILGPSPWTRIMPTGGVEATAESITSWFKAGVAAVGIGSDLIRKDWVNSDNFAAITQLTADCLEWSRTARGLNVFTGIEHVGLAPQAGCPGVEMAQWYQEVFGFRIKEGNSSFFIQGESPASLEIIKAENNGNSHIAVSVSNFEAAVAALKRKGIELDEPVVKGSVKAVYLRRPDPAGNRIHLIYRQS